jgi:site-specific DNA-methyltransferase (adenine-specific)
MNKIIQGDCLEELKKLPDNSVDTLITDPPYGLSFMGKKWDYDVPSVEVWKEVLRVLKPGATALIFAGSRTQHRMACNVEDAGFELRDCIMWIYGSGFPKSFNIGKGVDKIQGNEREVTGSEQKAKPTFHSQNVGGEIKEIDNIEITKGTSPFEGYGTQLKPAYEPIIVAMKPNDGNFVNNALKWGVAGLNIDAGRIGTATETHSKSSESAKGKGIFGEFGEVKTEIKDYGRFPANVIFDEEAGKVLDEQSGISKSKASSNEKLEPNYLNKVYGNGMGGLVTKDNQHNDKGGASRFFYCAKASKGERNDGCEELEEKYTTEQNKWTENDYRKGEGEKTVNPTKNNHPTVKPLKLMEYLCKITRTPTGGIVLDPFAGSGTTGVACKNTNRNYILIEREKEYIEIINARLNSVKQEVLFK